MFRIYLNSTGKFYYFKTMDEIVNCFTVDEVRDSNISVVVRASVIGYLDAARLAEEMRP